MVLSTILSGAGEGLLWAILAIGVYISYRVLDFADLSVEGSVITGASVTGLLIVKFNVDPFIATFCAVIAGAIAGFVTGALHTKLKIAPILSGILTMTALYSVNIRIMGSSSISFSNSPTVLTMLKDLIHLNSQYSVLILGVVFVAAVIGLLYLFFGTQIGSIIRATGCNDKMCRAQGINTDNTKMLGLAISNALVALAGSLLAQCRWMASNYSYGVGAIVIGLASVIIGETIFHRVRSFWMKLISVAIGSMVYRIIIAIILMSNFMDPSDLKLFSAIIVAIALSIPTIKGLITEIRNRKKHRANMPRDIADSLKANSKCGEDKKDA